MDGAANMDNDDEAEAETAAAAAAAVIADETEIEENEQKLTSLLKRKKELPLRTRNTLNGLVKELLSRTKDDIHDMLCDQNEENYQGLDSDRDTEAEVETALRFFPEVLPLLKDNLYPIQRLCRFSNYKFNVKAASFVSILARVAIESHSFGEHERGGLLIEGVRFGSSLCQLVDSSGPSHGEEHNQIVNNLFLRLLVRLRQMGLLIKADIQEYQLTHKLLNNIVFAENRLRFLIQWDPTSLTHTTEDNEWLPVGLPVGLPLHLAALGTNIREFQVVLEYGIRYYPNKKGITLLFIEDIKYRTPFRLACLSFGRGKVMEVVNDILARYHSSGLPLNTVKALMMAAINDDIHLDCVLFLMQREPDVIVKLLSKSINNNNNNDDNVGESGGDGGVGHDYDDDNDEDENENGKVISSNNGDIDIDYVNNTNNEVISRKRKSRG